MPLTKEKATRIATMRMAHSRRVRRVTRRAVRGSVMKAADARAAGAASDAPLPRLAHGVAEREGQWRHGEREAQREDAQREPREAADDELDERRREKDAAHDEEERLAHEEQPLLDLGAHAPPCRGPVKRLARRVDARREG